ncbi:hypothetical protein DBV39_06000 [Orrella marina]|uniref:Uncharacterized protein n=1 Tax=Orrella marina TaxID=2163011 RepID=A0A2R4XHT1_9BURK|nr:hypothetical protein DBV39_06000 [Orrella marina]
MKARPGRWRWVIGHVLVQAYEFLLSTGGIVQPFRAAEVTDGYQEFENARATQAREPHNVVRWPEWFAKGRRDSSRQIAGVNNF